jgi:hypothetical protein
MGLLFSILFSQALQFYGTSTHCSLFQFTTTFHTDLIHFLFHINLPLVGWLFTVLRPSQEFFTDQYRDVITVIGEGLQNLGLCLAFRAFEQEGIFIMPHLL